MPAVSVIIPTYNHRDYVLKTLESVFQQTFTDYEVIVVNDGSPDDTAQLLRPLADAGRIRYIAQDNAGQASARNRAIAEAQGEFVALLDDDDLWPADKLEWQVKALLQDPDAILVYGSTSFCGPGTAVIGEAECELPTFPSASAPSGWVYDHCIRYYCLSSPGQTLIRTDALRRIGGFDASIWGADDYDLYIRLAAEGRFLYEDHRALFYRWHSSNASRDLTRMYRNTCKVRRKHLGRFPRLSNYRLWFANYRYWRMRYRMYLIGHFREHGYQALRRRDFHDAWKHYRRAIWLCPTLLLDPHLVRDLVSLGKRSIVAPLRPDVRG